MPLHCIFFLFLQALDNVPVLLYILALKTLLLCLAFAGVKIYQNKKEEEALKKKQQEKRRLAQQTQELLDNLKQDWELMLSHGTVLKHSFQNENVWWIVRSDCKTHVYIAFFSRGNGENKRWATMTVRLQEVLLRDRLKIILYTVRNRVFSWCERLFVSMEIQWHTVCMFHLWTLYLVSFIHCSVTH